MIKRKLKKEQLYMFIAMLSYWVSNYSSQQSENGSSTQYESGLNHNSYQLI